MARKGKQNKSNLIFIILYIIYAVMIILSSTIYLAENEVRGRISDDKFSYDLIFYENGQQSHYYVVLTNPNELGYVSADYTLSVNLLAVKTTNIKELKINCRSIAQEKNEEILNKKYIDDTNAYKQYFIDKELFNVKVVADHKIQITFIDVPFPYEVIVNGRLWKEAIDYSYKDGEISTSVPEGFSDVDIYFVSSDITSPIAMFNTKYQYLIPNAIMEFNASISTDDGIITDYLWDFGDGNFDTGMVVNHSFSFKGRFNVILTVRDDDGLIDTYGRIIFVKDDNKNDLPDGWEELYDIVDPDEDIDDDLLTNRDEYLYGTHPHKYDTDGDGYPDGEEIQLGTDPLDESSYPSPQEARETGAPNWIIITGIGIVLIVMFMTLAYFISSRRTEEEELGKEEILIEKKPLTRKIPKKREISYSTSIRKPVGYAASKIPKEVLESDKKVTGLLDRSPLKPPHNPPIPPGRDTSSRKNRLGKKENLLRALLIDDELELPRGMKIVYECPTCESPVKKDEEFCQNCGEHFED